jgi:hypothetical protein
MRCFIEPNLEAVYADDPTKFSILFFFMTLHPILDKKIMPRLSLIALFVLAVSTVSLAQDKKPILILISLDGFRHD